MADMHTPLAWRVDRFFETFRILHNLNLWDLEEAGVITPGAKGGSDWKRFNNDLTTFVLKLPAARVEKLFLLVESRLPRAQDAETIKALEAQIATKDAALLKWAEYDQLLRSLPGEGPLYGGQMADVDAAYDACRDATEVALAGSAS